MRLTTMPNALWSVTTENNDTTIFTSRTEAREYRSQLRTQNIGSTLYRYAVERTATRVR